MIFRRKNLLSLQTSFHHSNRYASIFITQVKQEGLNLKSIGKPWWGNPRSLLGHPSSGKLGSELCLSEY